MQHRGDIAAWLRLQLTPGVGAVSTRRLLAAFSLPDQIFRQSQSALEAVVSEKQAKALLREPVGFSVALQNLEGWLNQSGQRFVALGDPDYPQSLLQSPDPPLCLYVQCADWQWWQLWAKEKQPPLLGMVGSRKPSPQGERTAQTWAKEITQSGFSVISGLALGVDAAAHKGALQAPAWGMGRSIAVVGTGLDVVYPRQHTQLAQEILNAGGAILSEFPLGTPAIATNFPKRNRIIAGLGLGVVVIEAALQSGSLITARLAMEANREVFALPGSIYSPQSQGCHALIKQGAQLVESAQEVIQALPPQSMLGVNFATNNIAFEADKKKSPEDPLSTVTQKSMLKKEKEKESQTTVLSKGSEKESPLLLALGFAPISLEALLLELSYSAAELQMELLQLELAGKVSRLPGGLYQRLI